MECLNVLVVVRFIDIKASTIIAARGSSSWAIVLMVAAIILVIIKEVLSFTIVATTMAVAVTIVKLMSFSVNSTPN